MNSFNISKFVSIAIQSTYTIECILLKVQTSIVSSNNLIANFQAKNHYNKISIKYILKCLYVIKVFSQEILSNFILFILRIYLIILYYYTFPKLVKKKLNRYQNFVVIPKVRCCFNNLKIDISPIFRRNT